MKILASLSLVLAGAVAQAAIPSARMILQRTAENGGSGSYVIEQEVQIPNGAEPLSLKETWIVDGERGLRVTVAPLRDPKESVRLQILYVGGQRWILKNGSKDGGAVPADFAERPFHWRSLESAIAWLSGTKIVPASELQKKPLPKKSEDIKREPEDFVRLSRTGGTIAWAFGTPSSPEGDGSPGLWIEQDQFVVRKIRFPSLAEVTADSYAGYARGLKFPKQRLIHWGANSVPIRVLSVTAKGPALSASSLDTPWKIQGLEPATQSLIEEFYTRFR